MRILAALLAVMTVSLATSEAEACWWRHHCNCQHHRSSSGSRFGAPSSTVSRSTSQNTTQAAPAYMVYQPQVVMAPNQARGLNLGAIPGILSLLGIQPQVSVGGGNQLDLIKLLEVIRELRDRRPGDDSTTVTDASNADIADIKAKLDTLIEGQKLLGGRVVNNASILRDIGQATVEQGEMLKDQGKKVDDILNYVGPTDGLLKKMADLNADIQRLRQEVKASSNPNP